MILHSRIPRQNITIHRPAGPRMLRVLAVGDVDHAEFSYARQLLDTMSSLSLMKTLDSASESSSCDLVVIFQSRPGSFSHAWVRQAQQRMPLAGFVVLLGTWCEGEQRTGMPLPYCERVFCYHFPTWWRIVQQAWSVGQPTCWQTPMSLAREKATSVHEIVAIEASDAASAEALITACDALGLHAVWSPPYRSRSLTSEPVAGIWVGGQLDELEAERLRGFREKLSKDAPLVALLDFPRRDRVRLANELGATAVLGKPWRLEELATCLSC